MEKIKRIATLLTPVIVFTALALPARAEESKIELKGVFFKTAKAEVMFKDYDGEKKEIIIKATGLKAYAVFSVWFLNPKQKESAGLGYGNFDFTSNGRGEGYYRAVIPISELDRWEVMAVYFHPDGDARNAKERKDALKGRLKKRVRRGLYRVW